VDLNSASWGYVEPICPGGVLRLLSKIQDEVLDFFEQLAWGTYAFEQARKNFRYPTYGECDFHANPFCIDHFIDSHDPSHSYVPPIFCDYYESSNPDTCNCPYCDYIDAICVSVEKKINELTDMLLETMMERIVEYS